jgi:succinate dehydrogenase/fumarate reductase flavoprotein subunit
VIAPPLLKRVDVAVLGSGAAGLLAATEASIHGARAVVLTKGQVGRSGATATITGDISVDGATIKRLGLAGNATDSVEQFYQDTLAGGAQLNDPVLAGAMVEDVGAEVGLLLEAGLKVSGIGHAPGHRYPRGVLVSGMQMLQILTRNAIKAGVLFRDEFYATDILVGNDGAAAGIAGIDLRSGCPAGVEAASVVLATGGGAMAYPITTAPEELVGDGYRMAFEAGAELIDMEMVQFLPCCLVDPPLWRGIQFPWIIGPQSGTRAWLLNRYGERFMERYDPARMEMSTRDIVSIACVREVLEGRGGPAGGVFMSWAHLPRDILDFLPQWYGKPLLHANWRWEGFDFAPLIERIRSGYAVEVAPASHFHMGGVRIGALGETRVPGLFACGEVAGGVHGANRLSGNACSQILVQGRRTGRAAANHAKNGSATLAGSIWDQFVERVERPLTLRNGVAPHEIMKRIQTIAKKALNVVRTGDDLREALEDIRDIRNQHLPSLTASSTDRPYNRGWIDAIEVRGATLTVEAIALSALERRESRGAHFRADFPTKDERFLANSALSSVDGAPAHRLLPVSRKMPDEHPMAESRPIRPVA